MTGLMYHQGEGVAMDYKFAKYWYLLSAKQGYANSQFMYAFMLQAGEVSDPDPFNALVWSTVAGKNGKLDHADVGDQAKLQLEDDQIVEALKLADICVNSNYSTCPAS
tara:strand:+ start:383 stop:706 length:324 start_codon:yes stop_codon:yes gene_type:complete